MQAKEAGKIAWEEQIIRQSRAPFPSKEGLLCARLMNL